MSKKTRKKSSKKPSPAPAKKAAQKAITAKAARGASKAPAKKPAAKAGKAIAKKSAEAAKSAKSPSAKASHKPALKPLKSEQLPSPKSAPVEGAKAPGFNLPRDGGGTVSLGDYAGKKLVLFFYPRADTPGCTREAIDFTRLKGAFAETGAEVVGISADTIKAQESFRNKHQLSIPLISDEQHEMLEAYEAWGEKSMYGRTFLGILRTTVLIGADGRIARVWRNVRVDGHADEVLAAAQAL
jgi:thioredoxin-dependent peroxiredoxin